MKILGIDYGRSKLGLAISEDSLAEPYKVIRVRDFNDATEKVVKILQIEEIEKVVVGVSEGVMAKESKRFASVVGYKTSIQVKEFDETLSSQDAQKLSLEAGISRKKRHSMEDAYAATIILQNYLDSSR